MILNSSIIMNRYLKLFLVIGISSGFLSGVFYSLKYGLTSGLMGGLLVGVSLGSISLILGFMHGQSIKNMPYEKSKETMGVQHVRDVKLQIPYDKAFDLCVESLKLIKRCKIRKENRSGGTIFARTGITWKTWGDVILLNVHKINNNMIQVEVLSRPSIRTTLVDYGKNLENVEKIIRFLQEQKKK